MQNISITDFTMPDAIAPSDSIHDDTINCTSRLTNLKYKFFTISSVARRIVVSGGGSGIGRAIALSFANSGDSVAVVGRRLKMLEETASLLRTGGGNPNGKILSFVCDLENPDSVAELTSALKSSFGSVDVIVNNAGGVDRRDAKSLKEIANSWLADFGSNVLTSVLLTESLLPILKSPGGRIINMSSIAALRGGGGSYSAAKAALIAWTYDLAKSLGPKGITVNAVAPGYITGTEFFAGRMTKERHDRLVGSTLMGRAGLPGDVASMVSYLASEEASYVTGQVLQVNGGALLGR